MIAKSKRPAFIQEPSGGWLCTCGQQRGAHNSFAPGSPSFDGKCAGFTLGEAIPEPAKPRRKAEGYGRPRWRCDADGEGFSVDHVGNGSADCPKHPCATRHDWRMGGGMAEAEAWIAHMVHLGLNVPNAIERQDGMAGYQTTQGEVAMCWVLMSRWGRLSAEVEAF